MSEVRGQRSERGNPRWVHGTHGMHGKKGGGLPANYANGRELGLEKTDLTQRVGRARRIGSEIYDETRERHE